jgi:hypothetical protein
MSPRWGLDTKTDWLTDRQSHCDFATQLRELDWKVEVSDGKFIVEKEL